MTPHRPFRARHLEATPRVSVILPAYNYAEYLPQAIETALAQDYPADRLEIIAVDDGSTDDTPAVLARYADRIRVIRRENGGLNAATTTGMEAATGSLLTFLDADDTWPADRTRALVGALRATPQAGIAYGDMEVVDADGATVYPSFRTMGGIDPHSGRIFGRLLHSNFVSAGALMVRAELKSLYHPIPPHAAYQDWWIVTQVARRAEVVAISDIVNHYRFHDTNMNLGADEERRAKLCAEELPFRRWLLQTLPQSDVSAPQVIGALRQLDGTLAMLMGLTGKSPAELLGLTADDRDAAMRALERASAALDERKPGRCLIALAAAIGHDPLWDEPRGLVEALAPVLDDMGRRVADTRVTERPLSRRERRQGNRKPAPVRA